MPREKQIYLRLVRDLEKAHEALDVVDRRLHELLDEIDQQIADKVKEEHQRWMDDDGTS